MKFSSRHEGRDLRLPEERRLLLNRILDRLQSSRTVEGIFIGGSIAQNKEDLFSDIDLRIVVPDDQFPVYVQNKRSIMSEFGDVLFYEETNPNAPFTIAHYANFIKVDLFIYTFSRLQPSLWLQDIKIVFDPTGKLQEIRDASNAMAYRVTKEEVEKWRGKLFAYVHEVYRRVMREEYYYALTMINNLRLFIVHGWNMEAGRLSNAEWDWAKIEGSRSSLEPWQMSLLKSWMCGRDQEEIMKTLCSMIPEIRRLHGILCDMTGLERNEKKFDQIINLVL
jgi:predicted nucleotidyltransferase